MIREIMKDPIFLSQKAKPVTKPNAALVRDMIDTCNAIDYCLCVGMAANMIGVNEQVIVICDEPLPLVMYNPKIIGTSKQRNKSKEACLCHTTQKEVLRYDRIKVEYYDEAFAKRIKTFTGFRAMIVQHELDHLEGILI